MQSNIASGEQTQVKVFHISFQSHYYSRILKKNVQSRRRLPGLRSNKVAPGGQVLSKKKESGALVASFKRTLEKSKVKKSAISNDDDDEDNEDEDRAVKKKNFGIGDVSLKKKAKKNDMVLDISLLEAGRKRLNKHNSRIFQIQLDEGLNAEYIQVQDDRDYKEKDKQAKKKVGFIAKKLNVRRLTLKSPIQKKHEKHGYKTYQICPTTSISWLLKTRTKTY